MCTYFAQCVWDLCVESLPRLCHPCVHNLPRLCHLCVHTLPSACGTYVWKVCPACATHVSIICPAFATYVYILCPVRAGPMCGKSAPLVPADVHELHRMRYRAILRSREADGSPKVEANGFECHWCGPRIARKYGADNFLHVQPPKTHREGAEIQRGAWASTGDKRHTRLLRVATPRGCTDERRSLRGRGAAGGAAPPSLAPRSLTATRTETVTAIGRRSGTKPRAEEPGTYK